ncbi:phage GP46 family protein [Pantoea rodasii]|uniref:phage GP46 family protein n=1 Tax=Pantoea rodasii TaxID=1076549 RepID=UPI0034514684
MPRKDTEETRALAEQYAYQALQPLIADARAQRVTVSATRYRPGWLRLSVRLISASGVVATFEHPVRVS